MDKSADLTPVLPQDNGEKLENFFHFFDAFSTYLSFFSIFINSDKTRFAPILLTRNEFTIMCGITQKNIDINHCGIYSYIIRMLDKKKFYPDVVTLSFSEKMQLPLMNLIIRNCKTKKIEDMSNVFILPSDAALLAFMLQIPFFIDKESIQYFSFPLPSGIEINVLMDYIRNNIMAIEEQNKERQQ